MNHSEDHEHPNRRTTRILHARPTLSISPDVPGAYGDHLPVNIEFPQMSTNILESYQHRQSLAIPPTSERSCCLERARGGPKRHPNQTEPRKEPGPLTPGRDPQAKRAADLVGGERSSVDQPPGVGFLQKQTGNKHHGASCAIRAYSYDMVVPAGGSDYSTRLPLFQSLCFSASVVVRHRGDTAVVYYGMVPWRFGGRIIGRRRSNLVAAGSCPT